MKKIILGFLFWMIMAGLLVWCLQLRKRLNEKQQWSEILTGMVQALLPLVKASAPIAEPTWYDLASKSNFFSQDIEKSDGVIFRKNFHVLDPDWVSLSVNVINRDVDAEHNRWADTNLLVESQDRPVVTFTNGLYRITFDPHKP